MGVIQLLQSHIDDAVLSLEKASSENARLPFVHSYLAGAYALKGQTERAQAELIEAQKLSKAYSSLANVEKSSWFDNSKIRALAEATYFPALRKAGLAEE
jgi:hypothetical protein